MKYFWAFFGWIWAKRKFFAVTLIAAVLFFALLFPFSDMSDAVTTAVSKATNDQLYIQLETFDLNLLPTPAVSARNVTIETPALPTIEAAWIKVRPAWLNLILNLWTIQKASTGDAEAASSLGTRLGLNVDIEGFMGGDVDLALGPGSKSDGGLERSKVSIAAESLNLADFQKWIDLPMKMSGQLDLETLVVFTPGMVEQPEGEIELKIEKFSLPASTLQIPVDETNSMPVNVPALTLANLNLRGRLVGGQFIIEDGRFGSNRDPLSGRIKGQIAMSLDQRGGQMQPNFGRFDLRVELNTTKLLESQIGFAFILFKNAKRPTATGSYYLFQASGSGFQGFPTITQINTF